jgi:hypothetical protein
VVDDPFLAAFSSKLETQNGQATSMMMVRPRRIQVCMHIILHLLTNGGALRWNEEGASLAEWSRPESFLIPAAKKNQLHFHQSLKSNTYN